MKYRIGHPAYNGTNAMAHADSRNAAIELLRERGVKRDEARRMTAIPYATGCGGIVGSEVVECNQLPEGGF